MTNLLPSDDEMISSYLDGEATSDEVARIEANPEFMARVSILRAAARLSAQPVAPLEAGVVDKLVTVALDAGGLPDNVSDLGAATRRRSISRALLAAAAVVLVALAVPAIKLISSPTSSSNSTAMAPTSAPSLDAGSPTGALSAKSLEQGNSVAAATTTAAEAASMTSEVGQSDFTPFVPTRDMVPDFPPSDPSIFDLLPDVLQSVPDMATLRRDLVVAFSGETAPTTAVRSASSSPGIGPIPCAGSLVGSLESGPIAAEVADSAAVSDFATVSIDGVTNLVALVRISPDRAVAFVVDTTTCAPVRQLEIAP